MTPPLLPQARIDSVLRVSAVVATLAFIVLLTFVPVSENDFWLQAKIGQMIVENGEIPRTVLFPFTWVRDNPFNAHEWLPSILFHGFDRTLGFDRLLFVQGALGLLVFGLSLELARRLSGSLAIGLLLAAMAMLVANYRHQLRPEIFALVLMIALLMLLSTFREHGDRWILVWSLPISILWANSHGSFALGPVIAGLHAVGEGTEWVRRHWRETPAVRWGGAVRAAAPYALVAGGMTLASLLNPLGVGLLTFVLDLSGSEVTKTFIGEWAPTLSPWFLGERPFAIFVAALVSTLGIVVVCRRRVSATDALLLLAFAFLAFQRNRFIVLFGFVALVVSARLIGGWPPRRDWERVLLGVAAGVSLLGVAVVFNYGNARGAYPFAAPNTNFSEPMVAQLSRPDMRGNVINTYELGAELIYRTYPRLRPSIDSRIDSYGDTYFLMQQELLIREPMLKEFVADFDVRYMLLTWRDFNQLKSMNGVRADWRIRFADHKAVLLERTDAAAAAPAP